MAELIKTGLFSNANLVAYYRFESGALTTDSKGAYTLTNNGTAVVGTGKYGGCVVLNGSTQWMSVANDMGITNGAISMSFWVKMGAEPGLNIRYRVAFHGDTGTQVDYQIWYEDSGGTKRLCFYRVRESVGSEGGSYNVTLGTTTLHHIVFTYDTTNIRGYLNNALVYGPTAASGNGLGGSAEGQSWGADIAGNEKTNGSFDDAAVFNDALTANEITEIYQEHGGSFLFNMV